MNSGITRSEFQKLLSTQSVKNGSKVFVLNAEGKIDKNDKLDKLIKADTSGRLEEAFNNLQTYASAMDLAGNPGNLKSIPFNAKGDGQFGIVGFDQIAKLAKDNKSLGDADLTAFQNMLNPKAPVKANETTAPAPGVPPASQTPGPDSDVKQTKTSANGIITGENQNLKINNAVQPRVKTLYGPIIHTNKTVSGAYNQVTFTGGIKTANTINIEPGKFNKVVINSIEKNDRVNLLGDGWRESENGGTRKTFVNDLTGTEVNVFSANKKPLDPAKVGKK